jgi:glycosyltransferase involved in cell wall biosynthesis
MHDHENSALLNELLAADFVMADYLAVYPDIPADPALARDHYIRQGRSEGRYPSEKSLEVDRAILLGGGILDPTFYRVSAGLAADEDPARHYLLHGWRAGIEPRPGFEGSFLAPYYTSVGFHGAPAITYLLLGAASWTVYPSRAAAEEIAELVRRSELFDPDDYRNRLAPDARHLDPALHYVLVGECSGLPPSSKFDPDFYGEQYPDVAQAGVCFLAHYIRNGSVEGRRPRPRAATVSIDGTKFIPEKETVILVSHEASRTGAPIVALNIGQRLRNKYNIITLLLRGGDLIDSFREISAEVICLPDGDAFADDVRDILKTILRDRPVRYAIVNSIARVDILSSFGSAFLPTVTLIHEFASYSRPLKAMREALGWVTEPVFSTKVTAESFCKDHPAVRLRRIHILPQGHCQLVAAPDEDALRIERRRIQAAMHPPGAENAMVVLGCGTVHLRKGVDLFLATAAAVRRLAGDRQIRFVWIGHGYDPEKEMHYSVYIAEQLARSGLSDHVALIDQVTDLEPAYAMADLLFLASRLDPLPNVAIDAAMRGLPIVCFEGASGIAEILQHDAVTAESVVPHLNTEVAARRIIELMEDDGLRKRTGDAARVLAQASFDMDTYVARIDDIGTQAIEAMRQRRADFETLRDDPLFDAGISARSDARALSRDATISRFLAHWSAGRTAPRQIEHLDFRRPCAGFHPQIYAHHHPEVIQDGINPFADFIRKGHPQGPWCHTVLRPDAIALEANPGAALRTAIQAHFHYPELIHDFLGKLRANSAPCDLLLSTNEEGKAAFLREAARALDRGRVEIRVVPNRGRDLGPLLTAYGEEILRDYDIIGHLHAKRSLGEDPAMGEIWREFLWQHLLGDLYPMMDIALSQFTKDERLGLLFAEDPHLCDWGTNLALCEALAVRIGVELPLPPFFEFPVGTMFWARPGALAPLVELGLSWEDYPEEPVANDGTILHALERLPSFAAGKAGLGWATIHIPGMTR